MNESEMCSNRYDAVLMPKCVAYENVCVSPMLSFSHIIYSQIRDDFAATALKMVIVGGIYALPSPLDELFLTNVFDNLEAVADCVGALSIAQQPEKKEKKGNPRLDSHTCRGICSLYDSFLCWKMLLVQACRHKLMNSLI